MSNDNGVPDHQGGGHQPGSPASTIPVEIPGTGSVQRPAPAGLGTDPPPRSRWGARRLLWLPVLLALMVTAVAVVVSRRSLFAPVAPPAPSNCTAQVTITEGGSYTGCWTARDGTAAVTIATAEPVTLTNSTISGPDTLVENKGGNSKLAITNTRFSGTYPAKRGAWGGCAVALSGFDSLRMEHNRIERKGGVKLNDWSGTPSAHPVLVRYNYAQDIDGRKSDGNGGYSGRTITQFLQFDGVRGAAGIEIAWNEVYNSPGNSAVEDNISMYSSSGTQSSPIDIHDNYIDGAYPSNAASDAKYSGGGIMLGDGDGSWQTAHDNTVVSTTNYGIAISGGSNLTIRDNRVLAAGVLADGTEIPAMNVGIYVQHRTGGRANNNAYDNAVGWWRAKANTRNDWWLPDCAKQCSNTHLNESAPVTPAEQAAEFERWHSNLRDARITVGPL